MPPPLTAPTPLYAVTAPTPFTVAPALAIDHRTDSRFRILASIESCLEIKATEGGKFFLVGFDPVQHAVKESQTWEFFG
ncbi:hypothetical protein U1Q18_024680 [Sarracenia purpurea var. burkii]